MMMMMMMMMIDDDDDDDGVFWPQSCNEIPLLHLVHLIHPYYIINVKTKGLESIQVKITNIEFQVILTPPLSMNNLCKFSFGHLGTLEWWNFTFLFLNI